ncbi:MAG: CopG family transcriptional regulator [Gluconobacter albidus]|uniref:CopG family transcriptional regulator n=1 Tax=Gluconobacter oxydans TaxID=442 RepID=A0AB35AQ17_GLUOY|nr:CopG family transcriptional regulator [Gluconobacter oxydans]MBF0857045.1 CopG family transcriptional regulator [Gluconobacter oxydans]
MAILKRPQRPTPPSVEDTFIAGAPDGGIFTHSTPEAYNKGIPKGHKRQISLTIAPELLKRVDEIAKRTGQARAGIINMAIYRALEGDVFK